MDRGRIAEIVRAPRPPASRSRSRLPSQEPPGHQEIPIGSEDPRARRTEEDTRGKLKRWAEDGFQTSSRASSVSRASHGA